MEIKPCHILNQEERPKYLVPHNNNVSQHISHIYFSTPVHRIYGLQFTTTGNVITLHVYGPAGECMCSQ